MQIAVIGKGLIGGSFEKAHLLVPMLFRTEPYAIVEQPLAYQPA